MATSIVATNIEFACWEEWTGSEVAFFISAFCELPQYEHAIQQNLTGAALKRLNAANMLHKGLARAGVCDFDHQRRIAAAVSRLETLAPEELDQELNKHLEGQGVMRYRNRKRIPAPPARPAGKGRPRGCFIELHLLDLEALSKPRVASPTTARMQRPTSAGGEVSSRERYTPRPWAVEPIPDPTSPDSRALDPDSSRVSLRLRRNLATSLSNYEAMREAPAPIYGTVYVEGPEAARGNSQSSSRGGRQNGEKLGATSGAGETAGLGAASPSSKAASSAKEPLSSSERNLPDAWDSLEAATVHKSPDKAKSNKGQELREVLNMTNSSPSKGAVVFGTQAMLGSELSDAASGGVRGIQQIQAQKNQKKEDAAADDKLHGTLDTMHKVLGPDAQADESVLQALSCDRPGTAGNHHQAGDKSADPSPSASKAAASAAEASHEEQTRAATTLQCRMRQRKAMLEAEMKRHDKKMSHSKTLLQKSEEEAAVKIQAMHRGNKVRKAQEASSQRLYGATQSASQKGRTPSKPTSEATLRKEEENAATKIQAIHRGKKTRAETAQKKAEKQAATRIQAIHRGNKVRSGK